MGGIKWVKFTKEGLEVSFKLTSRSNSLNPLTTMSKRVKVVK